MIRTMANTLDYVAARTRNRIYDFVLEKFLSAEDAGLTQSELAHRLGKTPKQIKYILGAPGNWTIETISALLAGIAGEELVISARKIDMEKLLEPFPPENTDHRSRAQ